VKVGDSYVWAVANLAAALAYLGDTDEAERMLADLERRAREEWVSPMTLGVVYAALGRFDDAISAIERSFEERDCWVISLAVDPAWASLRGNPGFEALVATIDVNGRPTKDRTLGGRSPMAAMERPENRA